MNLNVIITRESVFFNIERKALRSKIIKLSERVASFWLFVAVFQFCIAPMYGIQPNLQHNIEITAIFTMVEYVRSYVWNLIFTKE